MNIQHINAVLTQLVAVEPYFWTREPTAKTNFSQHRTSKTVNHLSVKRFHHRTNGKVDWPENNEAIYLKHPRSGE